MSQPESTSGTTDAYQPRHLVLRWLEKRLPIGRLIHAEFVAYPTPRNLNYWWTFGAILSFMLGVQIVTGIVLAMRYTPHTDLAFSSVEEFKAQEPAIVMGRFGTDLYDGIARPLP